jgi:mono/diheme cytochrome c family protein
MRTAYFLILSALILTAACNSTSERSNDTPVQNIASFRNLEHGELVKRGEYLVTINTCGDCHSPKQLTPQGPIIDTTKLLSGHPANSVLPPLDPAALQPNQWGGISPDITAFAGPWGISYVANITPDSATGIGAWTEEQFIKTLRTGKHLGAETGRPILPPMPWQFIAKMTDEDLKAVYAYLKSIPPVSNRVPAPTPPNEVKLKKS